MSAAALLQSVDSLGRAFERAEHTQSALEPAGPQAERVANLSYFAFSVAGVVYIVTIATLFWAIWRARRRARSGAQLEEDAERRMTRSVAAGVAATVVVLLVFLFYDLSVGRALSPAPTKNPLTINIVGHQWWWDVQYPDSAPQRRISTANEVHVPVGEPVVLTLESRDVIHSVWIPKLAGKKEMNPGKKKSLSIQADTSRDNRRHSN